MFNYTRKPGNALAAVLLALCVNAANTGVVKAQFIPCLLPSCTLGGAGTTVPTTPLPADVGPIGPFPSPTPLPADVGPIGPFPSPTPPSGGGGSGVGGGFGAGIGLGIGLGLVNSINRPQPPQVIYQQPMPPTTVVMPRSVAGGLSPHDQFCLGKYKSYNIQTKRYLSYSGQYRFCMSPYM